MHRQMCGQIS
ncbi:unnamed protein product [Callosobruchus maculatus]|uniref:Uncharacterized protein n=1 Tax=Callosobruchus maculatus TaxID=64391 RepID=A0A653BH00_CALMS|nr:unnamed protein product [Callosobruchus maculatus]